MITLDMINTLALSGLVVILGYGIRKFIPPLERVNIPAPVLGGLVIALMQLVSRSLGTTIFAFDTALQAPLMTAFFTSIGLSCSVSLLRSGGPKILPFLIIAILFTFIQNAAGIAVAVPLGQHPLFGVMNSSVTLVGGPATGLAFAPLFEKAGITGASSMAIASAMTGILSGGLIGAPLGTWLITRHRLVPTIQGGDSEIAVSESESSNASRDSLSEYTEGYHALVNLVALLVAMWLGSLIGRGLSALGITLPGYIGAMIVGAAIRNIADITGFVPLSQKTIDTIGTTALSLFIAMAMMTLRLWELADVALPMLAVIAVQILLVTIACIWPLFRLFGGDYNAAIMTTGFLGFMLGTMANAMANMESLAEKFGPAREAFLVVPIVGAFFIDFANALIITMFLNIL